MKPEFCLKHRIIVTPLFLVSSHAAVFTNGNNNLEYTDPLNWSGGIVPVAETAQIDNHSVVSNSSVTNTGRLLMGYTSANQASTLTIQSGTLTFGGNEYASANYVGVQGGSATLTLDGGHFTSTTGALFISGNGGGGTGVVNVNAGSSLTLQSTTNGNLNISNNGGNTGSLNLNGGSVSVANTLHGGYSNGSTSNISVASGSTLVATFTSFGTSATGTTNLFLTVDAGNWNTIEWGALTHGPGAVNLNLTLTGDLSDWGDLPGDQLAIWETTSGNLGSASLTFNNQVAGLDGTMNLTTGIFTVIPEPSATLLGGIGMLFLIRRSR